MIHLRGTDASINYEDNCSLDRILQLVVGLFRKNHCGAFNGHRLFTVCPEVSFIASTCASHVAERNVWNVF